MARIAPPEARSSHARPRGEARTDRRDVGFPEAISDAAATGRACSGARDRRVHQVGFSARPHLARSGPSADHRADPFDASSAASALLGGVSSRLIRKVETTDEMINEIEATLLGDGSVRLNDTIVIISGSPMWVTGTTNLLKLHRVGERR